MEVAERGVEWRRNEKWSGGGRRGGVEEEGERGLSSSENRLWPKW